MAIMMIMQWDGVTPAQYEAVRESTKFETERPQGAVLHVCSFGDGAMHIMDIWESAEDFDRFIQARITPAAEAAGMSGQPNVRIYPAHNIFNPGVAKV